VMNGETLDNDVQYTINRVPFLTKEDNAEQKYKPSWQNSFGAFLAKKQNSEVEYNNKVARFNAVLQPSKVEAIDQKVSSLAAQSGVPTTMVHRLAQRVTAEKGLLPVTVEGWLYWVLDWLKTDQEASKELLEEIYPTINSIAGVKKDSPFDPVLLDRIAPGLKGWINGMPYNEIEDLLSGNPNSVNKSERVCPKTRELTGKVISRGLSFAVNIVSQAVKILDPYDEQPDLDRNLVESLGTLIRRGYNSPGLLIFASQNKEIFGRVQQHIAYRKSIAELFDFSL